MQKLVKDDKTYLINKEHHIILESRDQIKYPPLFKETERYRRLGTHCLESEDLMKTQFDNIFYVSNVTNPKIDLKLAEELPEVDGSNYQPEIQLRMRMQYQEYYITTLMEKP